MLRDIDDRIKRLKEEIELMEQFVSLYERYLKLQEKYNPEMTHKHPDPNIQPYQPYQPYFDPNGTGVPWWEMGPYTIC